MSVKFKVTKLDGGDLTIGQNDNYGIVNGSHSFVNNFDVKLNGKKVYDCNWSNHAVNINNLLEYTPTYAESTATNEFFFYLDTGLGAEKRRAQAGYNTGFIKRLSIIGTSPCKKATGILAGSRQ